MIDISPMLMLGVFILFIFLLVVLNKILFKPILAFMDNRKSDIKNSLQNASSNTSEVEALKLEAANLIDDAKREAAKIREEASQQAKKEFNSAVGSKKEQMEAWYADYKKELAEQRQHLKDSLMSQMPIFRENLKAKLSRL